MLAATIMVACAANSPSPPSGDGEFAIDTTAIYIQSPDSVYFTVDSSDSSAADYDRMFLEIHADLTEKLRKLEKSDNDRTRLAEIQSIVKTAEEFYLEGKPLFAVKLLTEAELLLRQAP
jgi:hypothetical protein